MTLFEHGAHVDAVHPDGMTALHAAAYSSTGKPDVIDVLIAAGADLEARTGEVGWFPLSKDTTPLHIAAEYRIPRVMAALLRQGANTSAKQDEGKTPLHLVLRRLIGCSSRPSTAIGC